MNCFANAVLFSCSFIFSSVSYFRNPKFRSFLTKKNRMKMKDKDEREDDDRIKKKEKKILSNPNFPISRKFGKVNRMKEKVR